MGRARCCGLIWTDKTLYDNLVEFPTHGRIRRRRRRRRWDGMVGSKKGSQCTATQLATEQSRGLLLLLRVNRRVVRRAEENNDTRGGERMMVVCGLAGWKLAQIRVKSTSRRRGRRRTTFDFLSESHTRTVSFVRAHKYRTFVLSSFADAAAPSICPDFLISDKSCSTHHHHP